MGHAAFTTTTRGLRRDSLPLRLFEKAKRFGAWNPSEIDFRTDRQHWLAMRDDERDLILRLSAMFQAGEEAVTLDLLPLIQVIARQGRLEEEIFLTSFLYDEAKHTDFFRRFLDEVAGGPTDLGRYHTDNYRAVFYQALPEALGALQTDDSPVAVARASATYNMIVEGMLAETGYHAYLTMLERDGRMPGQRRGIAWLKQDESRHIAYGVYLLSRLIAEDPAVWPAVEATLNALLVPAIGVIGDAFAAYQVPPFGLREQDFIDYATDQFQKRFERLERARGATPAQVEAAAQGALEEGA